MYYAGADASGNVMTWFDTAHGSPTVPIESLIEATQEQYDARFSQKWTVENGALQQAPAPTAAEVLSDAQAMQRAEIDAAYQADIYADIEFKTAAGVTQTFQADDGSQMVLLQATQGYRITGAVPDNFFWKAADNTLVAFTLADLEGLYTTVLARGWAAFQRRATLKAQIAAATTVSAVTAIVWS